MTLKAALGPSQHVNLLAASKCASRLLGGVVCDDGFVPLRDNRWLSTPSIDHLNAMIGYMAGTLEGYVVTANSHES